MKGIFHSAAFFALGGLVPAPLAQVTVRRHDTHELATLYADASGAAWTNGHPFFADEEGRFTFGADGLAGGYDVTVEKNGLSVTLESVPIGELQYYDISSFPNLDDPQLAAIAALTPSADKGIFFTGLTSASLFTLTAFARSILDDADQATARTTLGLGSGDTPTFAQVAVAGDPTTPLQVATKQYVDNTAAGFDVKPGVRLATTANDSLSGLAARDGVTPVAGDRVLVKAQTTPSQNGIYVAAAGAWTRATDMDSWAEVAGAFCFVEEGTANADTGWVCTANDTGTLGTTAITWSQFSGVGAYQALNANLTAIAGLSGVADRGIYFTGAGAVALFTLTSFARTLLDDADAATMRGTLAIVTSTAASALGPTASAGASSQAARVDHVHQYPLEAICIACSDEATALVTGTGKVTFRMPYAFTLTAVRASLTVAQTSGSIFTVDINEAGVSVLSTKLTIDNAEKTSVTAAAQPVISDSALADDAEITVDVDQVGDGTAKGLKIYLIGRKAA